MKIVQTEDEYTIYPYLKPDAKPADMFLKANIRVLPKEDSIELNITPSKASRISTKVLLRALNLAMELLEVSCGD